MRAAGALCLALGVACGGTPAQPSPLPIGQPFELRLGRTASLEGDVFVTFDEVPADSRCPIDAVCVRMGEALVSLGLGRRGEPGPALSLRPLRPRASGVLITSDGTVDPPWCTASAGRTECMLTTADGKSTASGEEFTVQLLQLQPYPRAATPIPQGDYVATLVVTPR